MTYQYTPSTSCFHLYPCKALIKKFYTIDDGDYIRLIENNDLDWGEPTPVELIDDEHPIPSSIELVWISAPEGKIYSFKHKLDKQYIESLWKERSDSEDGDKYIYIVTGIAPFGGVAVWLRGYLKSTLILWTTGEEVSVEKRKELGIRLTNSQIQELCKELLHSNEEAQKNLRENGIPIPEMFNQWMQQYHYRFVPLNEFWNGQTWEKYREDDLYYDDIDLKGIEIQRYDGSHDQTGNGQILQYHIAGLPKRLSVQWRVGITDFSAYYWINDKAMISAFNFTLFHNGCADFLLRIDTRSRQYGIALSGNDNTMEQVINEEEYQLLIFRNGHEYFRSKNFSQPEGAWQW